MNFDIDAFRELFLDILSRPIPVSEAMGVVIEQFRRLDAAHDWSNLSALPFDDEVDELAKILTRILTESPPPDTVKGFIFGAQEFYDGGQTEIALQLVSAERIDADDLSFGQSRFDLRYEPPIAIRSDILMNLHEFATALEPEIDTLDLETAMEGSDEMELSLIADHILLWSYSALAVAHACELTVPSLWIGSSASRKIYVGHGEDYLRLGFVEPEGFRREPLMD